MTMKIESPSRLNECRRLTHFSLRRSFSGLSALVEELLPQEQSSLSPDVIQALNSCFAQLHLKQPQPMKCPGPQTQSPNLKHSFIAPINKALTKSRLDKSAKQVLPRFPYSKSKIEESALRDTNKSKSVLGPVPLYKPKQPDQEEERLRKRLYRKQPVQKINFYEEKTSNSQKSEAKQRMQNAKALVKKKTKKVFVSHVQTLVLKQEASKQQNKQILISRKPRGVLVLPDSKKHYNGIEENLTPLIDNNIEVAAGCQLVFEEGHRLSNKHEGQFKKTKSCFASMKANPRHNRIVELIEEEEPSVTSKKKELSQTRLSSEHLMNLTFGRQFYLGPLPYKAGEVVPKLLSKTLHRFK